MADELSRVENILQTKIEGTSYTKPPLSRIEEQLIKLNTGGGSGGGIDPEVYTRLNELEHFQVNATEVINEIAKSDDRQDVIIENQEERINLLEKESDRITALEDHAIVDSSYVKPE